MKTLTEKYRGVLNESFSKKQFVRDARIAHPQLITQFNGFSDTVSILKQKGMISEEDKMPEYSDFANISDEAIRRGIDAELRAMNLMPEDTVSAEDQAKAKTKALKNLKKDPLYYLNVVSGESSKVDKHDKEVEVKKDNHVDKFNGLKKAELKEGVAKKLDMIRQHLHNKFTDPKDPTNKVIDDEMIDGFFSVAPDNLLDLDMDDVELEYDAYVDANYDRVDEDDIVYDPKTDRLKVKKDKRIAKSVEDVIDPADYVEIAQGYLKGFKRPHSLKDADLETLGRKIVKVLAKGDIKKAKRTFVDEVMGIDRKGNKKPADTPSNYTKANEQMTDQEMADIAKYGREDKPVKAFKPGDNWSDDFDYEGMLEFGMKIRLNTPIPTLKALFSSFEDVNYHTENSHLGMAIDAIEAKDKSEALDHIRNFKKAIKQTLVQFNEGANPNRRELEEAGVVISERVGGLQEFISLIEDRADETGFEPKEEAAEVIAAIADHYKLNLKLIQNYMDSEGPVNPFADSDASKMNEGIKYAVREGLFDRLGAKIKGGLASLGQKGKNFLAYMKGDKDAIRDPKIAAAFAKVASTAGNLRKAASAIQSDLAKLFPKDVLDALPDEAKEAVNNYYNVVKAAVDQSTTMAQLKENEVNEEPNEGNKFEAERLKAIKAGKDHFEVDGKKFPLKGVDADDKKRAAMAKESVKAIITKVLEEGVISEAATQELAKMADSYAGFDGMKGVVMSLQDIVTDIERYYDNTRSKIQKAFDKVGEVKNEEGLKVGGFLAPAIESAFNKDLRPVTKQGFTKGIEQPKVKVLSQAELDAARLGGAMAEAEPKQTVFTPVNESELSPQSLKKANQAVNNAKDLATLLVRYLDQIDDKENPNTLKNPKLLRAVDMLRDLADDEVQQQQPVNESPDGHGYLKVSRKDFKKAIKIISSNLDGNFMKLDFVDDDGAGNGIIYFLPQADVDVAAGQIGDIYFDIKMDLAAYDIDVVEYSDEFENYSTVSNDEAKIDHDCANHVLHEKYGHGICLEEQHTLLEDGTVTHYDVFFKEGSKKVKNIPIEELKIITSSHHGHKRRKK